MTKQEIGETIGFYIVVGVLGWALVSFFPLTWAQALTISIRTKKTSSTETCKSSVSKFITL